jgi:DNA-binding CsgD family transcriptional regulator
MSAPPGNPPGPLDAIFARYVERYPSVPSRLRELAESRDPQTRRRFAELMRLAEAHARKRAATLRAAYGLTPAEAAVALHIIDGGDIASYATQAGVSPGTVRVQLKSIFAKIGIGRQAALVKLGQTLF